jgi:hypothetical protein
MAKRNSMSTARRSRNRRQKSVTQSAIQAASRSGDELAPESLKQEHASVAKIIRDGRARLMKAQAVLGCVAFALLYEEWLGGVDRPSFADAVAAAQDLVTDAVNRLGRTDSVRPETGKDRS